MKFNNKIELKLESFDKCLLVCDQDAQWGNIFDFAASLKSIAAQKVQEALEADKAKEEKPAE